MQHNRFHLILVFLVVFGLDALAHGPFHTIKPLEELNAQCQKAGSSKEKVLAMLELAHYYKEKNNDQKYADSLYTEAIEIAKSEFDEDLLFYAYKEFLLDIDQGYENKQCTEACSELIEIADNSQDDNLKFEAYYAMAMACYNAVVCEDTDLKAQRAINQAIKNDSLSQLIKAKILMGKVLTKKSKIRDAFEYLCDARADMHYINSDEKIDYLIQYDESLYELYLQIENYDKAGIMLSHKDSLIRTMDRVDSAQLMWLKLDLITLSNMSGRDYNIKEHLEEVLRFTQKESYLKLQAYTLSQYRSWLLMTERFSELRDLMIKRFPEELRKLEKNDKGLYYVIHAFIHEADEDQDSSIYFYKLANREIDKSGNDYIKSHFYKRYGEYLLRQNDVKEAEQQFSKSQELALEFGYDNIAIEVSDRLEFIAMMDKDYESAYRYSKYNDSLVQKKFEKHFQYNLTELEINSMAEQKRIQLELNEQEKQRQHQKQYFLVLLIVVIAFIGLLVISSMAVPVWVIEMMAFFSILSMFEYMLLLLDDDIHHITHGEPLKLFFVKLILFSVLFPMHHLIEKTVTNYLKKNKLIVSARSFSFRKAMSKLWPWLSRE